MHCSRRRIRLTGVRGRRKETNCRLNFQLKIIKSTSGIASSEEDFLEGTCVFVSQFSYWIRGSHSSEE